MRTVSAGPLTGLATLLALLAALAGTVGLGGAGWAAGIGCGVLGTGALARALRHTRFGPADWVTLSRAVLAGGVAALTADSFARPVFVPALVALAAVALVLDALDGRVARRTGTTSVLGARFDLEVDAFLILVLSCYVARSAGTWVLAIGLARYGLVVASWMLAWLCEPAPPRYWCKVVAAAQGVVLTFVAADVAPPSVNLACLVAAAVLLAESFGREVWWKWQRHSLELGHRLDLAHSAELCLGVENRQHAKSGPIVVTLLGEQVQAG